jgi:hypothetical protein
VPYGPLEAEDGGQCTGRACKSRFLRDVLVDVHVAGGELAQLAGRAVAQDFRLAVMMGRDLHKLDREHDRRILL